jgi:hypothetical protein
MRDLRLLVAAPLSGSWQHALEYACRLNRPVLLVGPPGDTVDEADALLRRAKRRKLQLACSHPARHFPPFAKLKEIVSSGVLGSVQRILISGVPERFSVVCADAGAPDAGDGQPAEEGLNAGIARGLQSRCQMAVSADLCRWLLDDLATDPVVSIPHSPADLRTVRLSWEESAVCDIVPGAGTAASAAGAWRVVVAAERGRLVCSADPRLPSRAVVERDFRLGGGLLLRPLSVPCADPVEIEIAQSLRCLLLGQAFPYIPLTAARALVRVMELVDGAAARE